MNNDSLSADPKIVDAEVVETQSSDDQGIKAKLLSADHWMRFVFMVLFAIIAGAASYVISILIIIQFIFALVTGGSDERLQAFGRSMSQYIFQILNFLTYNSEDKPFPFADWPQVHSYDEDELNH